MQIERLVTLAQAEGFCVQRDMPLAPLTTFRVGGPADVFVTVPDRKAAARLLRLCRETDTPVFLLGNGSNLLVGDKGIRGVVWQFDPKAAVCEVEDTVITCDAGMPLSRLCTIAREHALTGLEFAFGIPGTVGGALYMNAGAYGGEMVAVVQSANVLHPDGTLKTVDVADMALSYRHSTFMETGDIITRVTIRLQHGDENTIREKMQELMDRRREKQPLEYPSAGSFFKRPTGYFAGALIEQCGLKGFTVGGAAVSEKHAGFVVNKGGATAADICSLSEQVIAKVKQDTGVTMQPEVRFVGEF